MKNTAVSIITIGDELLIGQVIDTNSAWMGQELNKIGLGKPADSRWRWMERYMAGP